MKIVFSRAVKGNGNDAMLHSFSSCDILQHCYISKFRGYHLLNNTTTKHTLVTSHNTLVTSEQSTGQLSNRIATATHIITHRRGREFCTDKTLVLYMRMFVCQPEHLRVNKEIKCQLSAREHTEKNCHELQNITWTCKENLFFSMWK